MTESETNRFDPKAFLQLVASETNPQRIIARMREVLSNPKGCWTEIQAEPLSIQLLLARYVVAPGAVAALCSFIGRSVLGPAPLVGGVIGLIIHIMLIPVGVLFSGFLMHKLAPYFEGTGSLESTTKLAAFSSYAGVAGAVFYIVPSLMVQFIGSIISLYGLYIFWVGLIPMVQLPAEKQLPFFVTYVATLLVITVLLSMVVTSILF